MRIGFEARWLTRGPVSGLAILGSLVEEVAAAAARRGHTLLLYVDSRDTARIAARFAGLPHFELRPLPFRVRALTFLGPLAIRARRDRLDVLVSHTLTSPGRFRRVVYIYDILFERYPQYFTIPERLLFKGMKWSTRRADRVLALSQFTKRELVHYGYAAEHSISVVYPGVPRRVESPVDDGVPAIGGPYFLYVGRLNARKNLPMLLQAATPVLRDHPNLRLVLAGTRDGKQSDLSVPNDVSPRVLFLGWQPDASLPRLFREAVGVVYPSFAEGFGLPVLEALQYGAPVITSRGSALDEAAGDAGLRVDHTDPADIGAAMRRLLSEPDLAAELRARAPTQLARFSWRVAAERICDACEAAQAEDRALPDYRSANGNR